MRITLRLLFALGLLWAPDVSLAQSADTYARQLQEYDRRVEEQRKAAEQHTRNYWVAVVAVPAVFLLFLVYSQISGGRQFRAIMEKSRDLMERSRDDVNRAAQQSQRILELLESIDRKLDRLGPPPGGPPA
jgi:hypothetical protein